MANKTIVAWTLLLVLALASCQSPSPTPSVDEPAAAQDSAAEEEAPQPTDAPLDALASLHVELADPAWDGESIPDGQQCLREGGEGPSTPSIRVGGIPEGADAIILEFSDEDYGPMDNGGHGKVGYMIPVGTSETLIPSIPGHTFDLPQDFFLVHEHLVPNFDVPGAYMPPCSGGTNHDYYVTAKAVAMISMEGLTYDLMGEGILNLGSY